MPAHTPCAHCGAVGFVRWERVITGDKATVEFSCGHCNHSWRIDDRRAGLPDRRRIARGDRRAS